MTVWIREIRVGKGREERDFWVCGWLLKRRILASYLASLRSPSFTNDCII
jgi:hypothetical protein